MNPGATPEIKLPNDVQGLMAYKSSILDYQTSILLGLGIVVAAGLLVWFLRRWSKRSKTGQSELSTFEQWQAKAKSLDPSLCFKEGLHAEYYFELSLFLRRFLEWSYGTRFSDMTTGEVKKILPLKIPGSVLDKEPLFKFFERSDTIKYAGAAGDQAEAKSDFERVCGWMQNVKTHQDQLTQERKTQESKTQTRKPQKQKARMLK